MGMDATDEEDALDQIKRTKEDVKTNPAKNDSSNNPVKQNPAAILPDEKRRPQKDSSNN